MSLGICPRTCEVCTDPDCYTGGCRYGVEAMLVSCEACGELHVAFLEPPVCLVCWSRSEQDTSGGR